MVEHQAQAVPVENSGLGCARTQWTINRADIRCETT
jgi:hypothetical protein